ncbi:sugar ABC transporter [Intrasporangium oryzae NRRL B-24470]|uniref:Transport permease protein n=1 Tax=Intrasporangium oryzae NRRL B-24470 TaxID=1386089 RepID=W9G545_9MICO|nr:ABC transporter permease [Intrasporangium oryzae]EWT01135.1 sugar ABC transporter [Intrasporangium oryzae NRRL B-24470]
MLKRYRLIWERRAILDTLVRRDLRVRYARSWLGYLWTIIDPLSMALIYFVVFALIFKRPDAGYHPYFLFLVIGLLVWQWFNASINETSRALLAEAKLVRSTNLPRELWVIRVVLAKGLEFLLSLPVLVVIALIYMITGTTHLNWRLIMFPFAIVLQAFLQLGIGMLLAPTTVLADDTIRVVRIFLRMLFYATPIIYALNLVNGWAAHLFWLNPLSGIMEMYRAGFFPESVARGPIVTSIIISVGFFIWGAYTFARLERAVLKEI